MNADDDLLHMSKEELITECMKLRRGIRDHRDHSSHELCWYVPELWNLLPDKLEPKPDVPPFDEFIVNCCKYRKSLDEKENKDENKK